MKESSLTLGNLRRATASKAITAATILTFVWSAIHPAIAWAKSGPDSAPARLTSSSKASTGVARGGNTELPPESARSPLASRARKASNAKPTDSLVAKGPNLSTPSTPLASLPTGSDSVSAQSIALPSGAATVGGLGESFSAQLTTGIMTLSVPFAVPSPRGNVGVSLGLVYSSSGGAGIAGVGWSLVGDVAISRQTDRGAPRYEDVADWHPEQDRFVFGAMELVPICKVSGASCSGKLPDEVMPTWADGWQYFRPRVEGSFVRFFWSSDHQTWRTQSKDGVNLELGVPIDSSGYTGALEANPSRPNEIYRWHLVRQYDARGEPNATPAPAPVNVVQYRYVHDGGIAYLRDVYHTSPAADPSTTDLQKYAHHARLVYEMRPDPGTSYRAGFEQTQQIRLAGVDVTSKPFGASATTPRELVRRYHLDYDPTTHASLLASVQMEGRCAAAISEAADGALGITVCPRLPESSFDYQHVDGPAAPLTDKIGLAFEKINETVQQLPNSPPFSLDTSNTSLVDVNSDSLPDVLVTAPIEFSGKHGVFFNGHNGAVEFAPASTMTVTGVSNVDANTLKLSNTNVAGLDLDADGIVDLVHMPQAKQYSVFTPKLSQGQ